MKPDESVNIQPLFSNVLVKPLKDTQTDSGIILAEQKKNRPVKGIVLAVADRVQSLKPGDTVYFHKHGPVPIVHNNETLFFIPEKDILAHI